MLTSRGQGNDAAYQPSAINENRSLDVQPLRAAWAAASPCILHGLRLWASVSLALLVAYWLELDNAYWAGTSASIVCQPILGASLRKGRFRAIGTMIGAVAIVILMSLFPQSRVGLLAGLTLWCAACGFLATILHNFASYAAALAGYTAAIVFADAVGNPGNTFHIAVTRATEICIGILAAGMIVTVTDFGHARRRLAQALGDTARDLAAGLSGTLREGLDSLQARTGRRELIRRVAALDETIDQAIGEAADNLRSRAHLLQAAVEGLFSALSAWRGIANHLHALSPDAGTNVDEALLHAVAVPAGRDWLDDPDRMRMSCDSEAHRLGALAASDLSTRLLADRVADALRGLARAANGLVLVTTPGREKPDHASKRLYVPDVLPAVVNALRIILVLSAVELFWIGTDWSEGQSMISFTAIGVVLFAPRMDEAYGIAVGFAVGTVITAGLAAVVNFAVLPTQHSFIALSLVLACVMVPLGAISAGPWQNPAIIAMVTNFLPLLAPANQPSYDPGAFYNAALAIVAGIVAAALSLRLIPPPSPAWRIERLSGLTLRDLRRLAIRRRWLDRRRWTGLVCQRVAALPAQASLEDAARLVAALSAGEAVIHLREVRRQLAGKQFLDRALQCLAAADIAGTKRALALFSAEQADGPMQEALEGVRARGSAAVITEALARHPVFFASTGFPVPK
jgi:uncharacterized membrane protein YccC